MKGKRDDECAPQWREKKQLVQRYQTISHLDRHKIVASSSRQRKSSSAVTLANNFCNSFLSRGTSLPSAECQWLMPRGFLNFAPKPLRACRVAILQPFLRGAHRDIIGEFAARLYLKLRPITEWALRDWLTRLAILVGLIDCRRPNSAGIGEFSLSL